MLNFPFQFTAHSQLGKEDIFLPAHSLGAANVDVAVNVGTGNVCVTDVVLRFPDKGTAVELAAIYNSLSQDKTPWRIAYGRMLRAIAKEASLVVVERDGREVTYVFDATTKKYLAKDSGRDHAYLYADAAGFARYDCESQVTDYFDANGLLQKQVDVAGNVTAYEYINGELSAILPPSGVRYELTRENQQISVFLRDKEKVTFLHRYAFDAASQGLTSETYDGYITKYQAGADGKLAHISQTDGSALAFTYVASGENKDKLASIQPGESNAVTLSYAGKNTSVTDATQNVIQFALDDKKRPLTVSMQNESTHYQYASDGQVDTIKHLDGSEEHFAYQAYGLLKSHEQRDGKTITHQYSEDDKPLLINKKIEADGKAANTQLIHENNLLRFEISPSGRVTAYQRNEEGLLVEKKQYKQDEWDISIKADLSGLLAWEEKIQALRGEDAYLSEAYQRDDRGQIARFTQGETSSTTFEHDDYGNVKRQTVSCQPNESLKTDFTYNALRKVTAETDGAETSLAQCGTTAYVANIATHTAANGRQTITETDSQNRIKKLIEKAGTEERIHSFDYVDTERAVIHTQPDKQINLVFFDEQNRETAQLSPSGALTSHTYLDQVRCHVRTNYAQAVPIADLYQSSSYFSWWSGETPKPSQEQLQAVIKAAATHPNNRTSYAFTGLNGKPQYDIDAAGYITEYHYDLYDHEQHVIQYGAKITETELQQLLKGASLARTPSRKLDRIHSSFTDIDGNEIAAQDPNGYITEWKRDAAGRAIEKTVYENNNLIFSDDWQAVRPVADQEKDAITYYFYNDLNQVTAEVDAEGFITTFTYDADGKISKQIRYENKVASEWFSAHDKAPIPESSKNDLTTVYTYDALRRLASKSDSTGRKITYAYNENNQQIAEIQIDENAVELNGDTQRGKQNLYDAWGQTCFSANSFVSQKLSLASDDEKQAIWQNSSDRSTFNEVGLLTKKTNATGICITYLYNKDRKPALAIKPSGAIIAYEYNVFGELLEKRRFYKRLDAASVAELAGGFIDEKTQTLISSLQDSSKDKVTTYERDERGLITQKTNASGYVSTFNYNAFKLCEKKHLPVNEKAPSLTVEQKFDLIGNVIEIIQSSPQTKSIKKSKTYGRFNAITEETNELGCHQKNTADRLGRLTEKQVAAEPGAYITIIKQELNALGSPTNIINANQQTTTIDYDIKTNTQLIHHPDGISKTRLSANVFGENIKKEQGYLDKNNAFCLLQKEGSTHAPDGQIATKWLGGNKFVDKQFNLAGQLASEQVHDTARASITYDQDGHPETRTVQANNQSYKTSYTHNALGQTESVTDPKNIKTTYQHENNTNTETKTIDPDGLALTTTREYNANKQTLATSEGDIKDKQQYRATDTLDNNGFKTAATIDPNGLCIKTQFERNEMGRVTKATDPNGHEKYLYYDLLGRKKAELKAWNETHYVAMQYDYTPDGQVKTLRTLGAPIAREAIATASTLSDMKALLDKAQSNEDSITHYLYNENAKEQFKLTLLYRPELATYEAVIEEKQYDAAGRENKTIFYAESIKASDWPTLTGSQITERLQALPHQEDRIHYRWHDEAGRECLTVDQDGRATAYQHDAAGNIILTIRYKNTIPNLDASFSLKDMQDKAIKTSPQDRKEYTVYDDLGQILFNVKPNKHITAYRYDENGNKTLTCDFKDPLSLNIVSYSGLVDTLKALVPEEGKDCITECAYDHANRKTDDIEHIVQRSIDEKEEIIVTAKDSYKLDALGNPLEHKDKEGNIWKNTFDKAKRMTDTLSPPVSVATPYFVPGTKKQLAYKETTASINKHTEFDAANNITCVTEASNTPAARSFYTTYHPNKQIKQTELKNVEVDDGSSYNATWDHLNTLPVKKQSVTTLCFYNTKGKKIAKQNENGDWSYSIYDSLERKIFSISTDKHVIKYTYNAFNEVAQEHHYETPLTLDLSSYQQDGIPCKIVTDALSPHENDQVIDYQHDGLGHVTLSESRAVFYYSNGEYGTAKPTTKQRFDTFGDIIYEGKLIRPGVWAEKFYWRDEAGEVIAFVDENNYVTRHTLNTIGLPTQTQEVVTPLEASPSAYVDNQLISELDKRIIPSDDDRIYQFEYTAYYLKKTEKLLNVVTHDIDYNEFDKNAIPKLAENLPQTRTKTWDHTLFGDEKCYTSESGNKTYKYYDARQQLIAEMRPNFSSIFPIPPFNRIWPLFVYKLNEFGQTVVMQTSPRGHLQYHNPHSYEPSTPEDKVAETIVMFDNRGLPIYKQDAENFLTAATFNAARKVSRDLDLLPAWHAVNQASTLKDDWVDVKTDHTLVDFNEKFTYQGAKEGWKAAESAPLAAGQRTMVVLPHVAEKRHHYDSENHELKTGYYVEGHLEEEFTRTVTGAGSIKTETDAKHAEGLIRKFDAAGRAWYTNENGGGKAIQLCDLLNRTTLRLTSANKDLSQVAYADLALLLNEDVTLVARAESIFDATGNTIGVKNPRWFKFKLAKWSQQFLHDRYGNIIRTIVGDKISESLYNKLNKLSLHIEPETTVVNEADQLVRIRPETHYYHDISGNEIAVKDAKNYIMFSFHDEIHRLSKKMGSDGVVHDRYLYDANNAVTAEATTGTGWFVIMNNNLGQHTKVVTPSGQNIEHAFFGRRGMISGTDNHGNTILYSPDIFNHVRERILPKGHTTLIVCNFQGDTIFERQANGASSVFDRTFFGKETESKDLGSRITTTGHNHNMQPICVSRAAGGWDMMKVVVQLTTRTSDGITVPFYAYKLVQQVAPAEEVLYGYEFDSITSIHSVGDKRKTTMDYDDEGVRVALDVYEVDGDEEILLFASTTIHNEAGLPFKTENKHLTLSRQYAIYRSEKYYDATRNYCRAHMELTAPGLFDDCPSYTQFLNVAIYHDIAGHILRQAAYSNMLHREMWFRYENGLRIVEGFCMDDSKPKLETGITYTVDGLLQSTCEKNGATVILGYSNVWPSTLKRLLDNQTIERRVDPDANGWPQDAEECVDGFLSSHTKYQTNDVGLPMTQLTNSYTPDKHRRWLTGDHRGYEYLSALKFILKKASVYRNTNDDQGPMRWADYFFNTMIEHSDKTGSEDEVERDYYGNKIPCSVHYENLLDGGVPLYKLSISSADSKIQDDYRLRQLFRSADGGIEAGYCNRYFLPMVVCEKKLHLNHQNQHDPETNGANLLYTPLVAHFPLRLVGERRADKDILPADPLNWFAALPPELGPKPHIVQKGETLESIAESQLGDKRFAAHVGLLNGFLLTDQDLKPGIVLQIPKLVGTYGSANESASYQEFISLILGSLSPTIVTPQPKHKKNHVRWFSVVAKMIAVAVILALAPGFAEFILLPALSIPVSATSIAIATGVSAAFGDGLVQAAIDGRVSLTEMLEVGVTAGVGTLPSGLLSKYAMADLALKTGAAAATTQLIEMQFNLRDKFDIRAVVQQVAAALIASKLKGIAPEEGTFAREAFDAASSTTVNTTLNYGLYGTSPQYQYMIASAIGSYASQQAITKIQSVLPKPPTEPITQKAPTPNQKPTASSSRFFQPKKSQPAKVPVSSHNAAKTAIDDEFFDDTLTNMSLPKPNLLGQYKTPNTYNITNKTPTNYNKPIPQPIHATTQTNTFLNGVDTFNETMGTYVAPVAGAFLLGAAAAGAVVFAPEILAASAASFGYASLAAMGVSAESAMLVEAGMIGSSAVLAGRVIGKGGELTSKVGLWGRRSGRAEGKAIGLTTRLNRAQIKEYLANAHNIPREQLIHDLESVGLKLHGDGPNGLFKTFEDKAGNIRIKIHPADSSTDYSHIHMYNKNGDPLTQNLTRAPYNSPDVHIRVEPIQKELEWRPR